MDECCKEIEDLGNKDQQLMYEKVEEVTFKNKQRTGIVIKRADGRVVMELEEVLERWAEYITELFGDNRVEQLNQHNNREGPPIMRSEVEAAMKKMKKGKAVGEDGIALEMLLALEEFSTEIITEIASLSL